MRSSTINSRVWRTLCVSMAFGGLSLILFEAHHRASMAGSHADELMLWRISAVAAYVIGIILALYATFRYIVPHGISRVKREGLSCPICFTDLRTVPSESAICPGCGLRYTQTGVKQYWQRTLTFPFIRLSDTGLMINCGLQRPMD